MSRDFTQPCWLDSMMYLFKNISLDRPHGSLLSSLSMTFSRRVLFARCAGNVLASAVLPNWTEISSADAQFPVRLAPPVEPARLNRNENAYGLSEKAAAAIRSSATLASRYPDREQQLLKEAIATFHHVGTEQIVLGGGSSELMRAAVWSFVSRGKKLILASPTFDVISREAHRLGMEVDAIPLTREYSHDLGKMLSHARGASGLVYICNPNNPTGSLTPRSELESFVRELPSDFYVLIDEAYHHYVPNTPAYASFIDKPADAKQVIVTRTFSKVGGLAGERIGYAVTSPETARMLPLAELESAVTVSAARAAIATLGDREFIHRCSRLNADDRQEFLNQVNARHGHVIDPHGNFVFIHAGRPAKEVVEHFETNGILIGPPVPEMNTHVRVSFGLPSEMQAFWRVWDLLIPAGTMHM